MNALNRANPQHTSDFGDLLRQLFIIFGLIIFRESTLVDFAHRNQITQIFLARGQERPTIPLWPERPLRKILGLARDMQIVIVSERKLMAD
jgi:hypothetical protein